MSTTKERVLAYFSDWQHMGENPENGYGIAIEQRKESTFDPIETVYCIGRGVVYVLEFDAETADDCIWEAAARILRIDNPWRLTSEELPPVDVDVLVWRKEWQESSVCGSGMSVMMVIPSTPDRRGGWWNGCEVVDKIDEFLIPTHWQPLPAKP